MKMDNTSPGRLYNLKKELPGKLYVTACGLLIIILTLAIVFFIASQGLTAFTKNGLSVVEFLTSTNWAPENPAESGGPKIGSLIFITGSIVVSLFAVLVSTPLSISAAIFMNEISPRLGEKILRPAIEIFVGIPSVVYGWVGLSILVPLLRKLFGGMGFSVLAGGIVLSIMIFPTITSLAADALRVLPIDYKEASYGLGATRWQTIRKVLVPAALPGILTGVVLGLARAFGEALAVQMVIGNSIKLPDSLLNPAVTLTSIITMDMGNTIAGSAWNNALWSMAFVLLLISFIFIVIIRKISARRSD